MCAFHDRRAQRGLPLDLDFSAPSFLIEIEGSTARVPLGSKEGKIVAWAIIDVEDLALVSGRRWTLRRSDGAPGYAVSGRVRMHRVIMGINDPKREVDHFDGDGLNNRRLNLRILDHARNGQNQIRRHRPPDMRNVAWDKRGQQWTVRVALRGAVHHIGRFRDLDEAKRAASEARRRLLPYANEDRHR
jgi:hypothetical protein